MRDDRLHFMTLRGRPPARLTIEQAAWMLGFQAHDIPILAAKRLLRPLGNPAANAVKYFSLVDVEECAEDSAWLSKATNALYLHWKSRNSRAAPTTKVDPSRDLPSSPALG